MYHGFRKYGYRIWIWKPQGKTQLGRRKCKWKNNIHTNLRVCNIVKCIRLKLRIGSSDGLCENGDKKSGYIEAGNLLTNCIVVKFSRKTFNGVD